MRSFSFAHALGHDEYQELLRLHLELWREDCPSTLDAFGQGVLVKRYVGDWVRSIPLGENELLTQNPEKRIRGELSYPARRIANANARGEKLCITYIMPDYSGVIETRHDQEGALVDAQVSKKGEVLWRLP